MISENAEQKNLIAAAAALNVTLSPEAAGRLLQLLDELARWNKTYNLTAITDRAEMLTHHLLDSLSIHPYLQGNAIADVGTGAGFPGLPLAVTNPDKHFTLIDSNNKKVRFVNHAAHAIGLSNVEGIHVRAEAYKPRAPFDTVTARAFAALPDLLRNVAPLCGPSTRVLAMKGRPTDDELAAIPAGWGLVDSHPLRVPGLDAARCVVVVDRIL